MIGPPPEQRPAALPFPSYVLAALVHNPDRKRVGYPHAIHNTPEGKPSTT